MLSLHVSMYVRAEGQGVSVCVLLCLKDSRDCKRCHSWTSKNHGHWFHMQAHLSPECVDLLNRIFVIDEKERISLAEIKAHPWYNKPLLAKHTHAEKQIAIQQAEIQRYIQTRKIDEVTCCSPPMPTSDGILPGVDRGVGLPLHSEGYNLLG